MSNDIIESAAAAGNFKTLASALKEADLVGSLKGKERLKGFLLLHVVPGNDSSSAVVCRVRFAASRYELPEQQPAQPHA